MHPSPFSIFQEDAGVREGKNKSGEEGAQEAVPPLIMTVLLPLVINTVDLYLAL